ncbi:MAG TPA: N-formylglutamate amidohydrolase [Gemmataceae bacterium]|jgi:N-formylglutamate amidohydrolase|nr:N-formylglutamate amidohydrolase [Gemmataceae bacterium]
MLRLFTLLIVALPAFGQDKPQTPETLITIRKGTLPIIISAPHGGRTPLAAVAERRGHGVDKFVVVLDGNTAELADKLFTQIEKKMGGKPYLVVAHFERKFIDVNRPADGAYEDAKAKPFYDAYHKALAEFSKEVQKDWGRGLLLDIHGQGADADAVFRGTANGTTVKALTDRFGKTALTGPKSILGQLDKQGFKVIPANDSTEKEDSRFNGGHTVRTYGSHDGQAIDAIQLELGGKFRAKANLDDAAGKIADAVQVFAKEYLPAEKRKEK